MNDEPKCFLSKSAGKWRVIYKSMPLCPDTTEENARDVARRPPCDISHGKIWNGDKGEWENDLHRQA